MPHTVTLNAPVAQTLQWSTFFDLMRDTGASFSVNICEAQLAHDAENDIPVTFGFDMGSISNSRGAHLLAELSKDLFIGIDSVTVNFGYIVSSVLTADAEMQDREIHILHTHSAIASDMTFPSLSEANIAELMRLGTPASPEDLTALAPADLYLHNPETGTIRSLDHVKRISTNSDLSAISEIVNLDDLGPDEQVHIDIYKSDGLAAMAFSLVDTSPELAQPTRSVLHAALQ